MTSPRSVTRHEALYRAVLVLYPRRFRAEYGDPMVQLFGDRLRDVGAGAWFRVIPDLIATVPNQRIEAVMDRGSGTRVVIIGLGVLIGTLLTIGVGGGAVPFLALVAVAVVVMQRHRVAALPIGARAPLRRAVVQTWWAPVAALLGFAMILFGIGTIFEAHNWGGRIAGSTVSMAFGVGMLLGLMRRPFAHQAGNTMILVATIPCMVFFWVVVPPLLAIIVWVGVLSSGFGDRPVTATPAHR
jgi:hypothetical protein